ncbi:SH3 domain-containing protein [Blastomonas sp. AAP53]|uniref:SH3 domain-containing protein n=1 Tax=Blastomonas sp. AAP53 TaxID=1248760 RepID=UPI0003684207|nr:SH3 domain-containing protein [Blastomonas sp. AAP53]
MRTSSIKRLVLAAMGAGALLGAASLAQAQAEVEVPYWASVQRDEAFARAGPMATYQIEWVFRRRNLPVKVIKRYGPWRQIVDPSGWTGWMHSNMLSRKRTAFVNGPVLAIRSAPQDSAKLMWRAEPGVVGELGECEQGWCEFAVDKRAGWVRQDQIWGAGEP